MGCVLFGSSRNAGFNTTSVFTVYTGAVEYGHMHPSYIVYPIHRCMCIIVSPLCPMEYFTQWVSEHGLYQYSPVTTDNNVDKPVYTMNFSPEEVGRK